MRGFQHMPAGNGSRKRRIVAILERGRWIVYRGWHRPEPAGPPEFTGRAPEPPPGGMIQVRFDTSGFGTSDDEMLRLCDSLAARWPDHVCEVLRG